ncbi:unnamed protein product, partial [Mesorhabditis belari]|uniref:Uncharacterized protein n=1 Tax=Mesorhabditis belari TaxID=2138241 RepID=A0AAF3EGD0_9BILA
MAEMLSNHRKRVSLSLEVPSMWNETKEKEEIVAERVGECSSSSSRVLSPDGSIQIEFDPPPYVDEFTPVMGILGAPKCRCTSSLLALLSMMTGLVLVTSGAAITFFFYTQEALVITPGVTLMSIGIVLTLLGCVSWVSRFMLHDCLARVYSHMKAAPVKEAQRRRAKRLSRMSGTVSRSATATSQLPLSRSGSQATVTSNLTPSKY